MKRPRKLAYHLHRSDQPIARPWFVVYQEPDSPFGEEIFRGFVTRTEAGRFMLEHAAEQLQLGGDAIRKWQRQEATA